MERDPEWLCTLITTFVPNVEDEYVENFFDFHIFEKSS